MDEEKRDVIICLMFLYICSLFKNIIDERDDYNRVPRLRSCSVHPANRDRLSDGYFNRVFKNMKETDPGKFLIHTRMTRPVYDLLLTLMNKNLMKTSIRQPITPEERLSLTLLHLAHGLPHQSIAKSYKLGKTTVRNIILETCEALWKVLSPIYVNNPTESEYKAIANDFENLWCLPNCVGVIDGKYIDIACPKDFSLIDKEYQKSTSLVLMATCDTKYTFTSVSIGCASGHRAETFFRKSQLGRSLLYKEFPLPSDAPLPKAKTTKGFPYYFVGDSAFPLRTNLMRPFPGSNLSKTKRIYNFRLSRAQRLIENSFGVLVTRWRMLLRRLKCQPDNSEKLILACVALHNFVIKNDKQQRYCPKRFVDWEMDNNLMHEGDWREVVEEEGDTPLRSIRTFMHNASANAFNLRNTLSEYFVKEGAVSFQDRIVKLIYGQYE